MLHLQFYFIWNAFQPQKVMYVIFMSHLCHYLLLFVVIHTYFDIIFTHFAVNSANFALQARIFSLTSFSLPARMDENNKKRHGKNHDVFFSDT